MCLYFTGLAAMEGSIDLSTVASNYRRLYGGISIRSECMLELSLSGKGLRWGLAVVLLVGGCVESRAQDSKQLIETLISHEAEAGKHRGHYEYMSEERSDRTGGHLWLERVAETTEGKLRYLQQEDGKPLTGSRLDAERARLAADAADPAAFHKREEARLDDEQHARQMLQILPRAFLFDPPKQEGGDIRIGFRPDPAFSPSSLEERVLHAMTGSVLIDGRMIRTREINGTMPQDVSIGFGILATIHAGSNFKTTREHAEGDDWKTESVHTDINGKALFLKTIARKQDMRRWGYKKIPDGLSVADAVKLVEGQ